MSHIDDDLLVDLALGEPADGAPTTHLRDCPVCRERLDSLRRTVAATRSSADVELTAPPASVWAGIEAELDRSVSEPPVAGDIPDRAIETTGAAVPAPTPIGIVRPARRARPATGWLAAAAVAGILVRSGVTALVTGGAERPGPTPTVATVAAAQLDTLDTGRDLGTAQVVRSSSAVSLSVSTHGLALPAATSRCG